MARPTHAEVVERQQARQREYKRRNRAEYHARHSHEIAVMFYRMLFGDKPNIFESEPGHFSFAGEDPITTVYVIVHPPVSRSWCMYVEIYGPLLEKRIYKTNNDGFLNLDQW